MNPNVGQPDNPYISFLNQLRGSSSAASNAPGQNQPQNAGALMQRAQNPMPGSTPGGAPISAQGAGQSAGLPGAAQPQVQDATIPGQNPGTTKQLVGAMSQLHGVITQLTDPEEIRMIRAIILMLNQLIQKDQQVQNQQTGSMTGTPQMPQGAVPGGTPTSQGPGGPSGAMQGGGMAVRPGVPQGM